MKRVSNLNYLFRWLRPYRINIIWGTFFYNLKHYIFISAPLIIFLITDYYIPAKEMGATWLVISLYFGLIMIHVFYHLAMILLVDAGTALTFVKKMRNHLIQKLQILTLSYYSKNNTGTIISKIMLDVDRIGSLFFSLFHNTIGIFVNNLFIGSVLLITNFYLFLILFAYLLCYAVIVWFIKNSLIKANNQVRLKNEKVSIATRNFLESRKLTRIHHLEEVELEEFYNTAIAFKKDSFKYNIKSNFFQIILKIINLFSKLLFILLGSIMVINGNLTFGSLLLFLLYFQHITGVIMGIVSTMPDFIQLFVSINSIREIDESYDVEKYTGKKELAEIRGEISFNNVSFFYDENNPIYKNLSIHITAGETVALVGSSGSGKSTFINLLMGMLSPQKGAVKIDQHDIKELNMQSIRKRISVVPQEAILFPGTIKENIAHAKPELSVEEVKKAAKLSHAWEFIKDLPDQLNASVEEYGENLSGGQKQRISIARAILRRPAILILDEATSSLDSHSERKIQASIDKLVKKQTTFIIAHRLSTIINADRILVFKNGSIVESGSHVDLLKKEGEYHRLFSFQFNLK